MSKIKGKAIEILNDQFKVGDKVYAKFNSEWGLEPMEIVNNDATWWECKHPKFASTGTFYSNDLIPYSENRERELAKLIALKDTARKYERCLFQ